MSKARIGKPESAVDVLANATMTTIVTLFSGRAWSLGRWRYGIASQDWPADNLHIVAVDNSRNPEFSRLLADTLDGLACSHTLVRDDRRAVADVGAADLAGSAKNRIANNYAMNTHLARLYARASQYLPAGTAHVWSVEDDVEVPADALRTLAMELTRIPDAGAVCGLLRSRFERQRLLCWAGGKALSEPPRAATPVDATGAYCLLATRAAWDSVAWRPGATLTDKWPYYDWAMCHDIRAAGHRVYAVPVNCRHWQADGTVMEV
jgi:hypothetical protein